jgi:hypothetical protein
MGASPAQRAQQAAKGAVEQALASQVELTNKLENRASEYEAKAKQTQQEIDALFGLTGKEFVASATPRFYQTIGNITGEYRPKLENFEPGIIKSPSYSALTGALKESGQEFGKAVKGVSEEGAARLYQTLAAPIAGFRNIERDPAFNLQYDPRSMALATRPPTIRSDAEEILKGFTNYNV